MIEVARAAGRLREFNAAGVLAAADVHVALRLSELAGGQDDAVSLAAALAVRAPRLGHVHVDLAGIRDTATVDGDEPVDLSALPWPGDGWVDAVAASPLVAVGEDAGSRPLRLLGTRLYLDRYWREERRVADGLRALSEPAAVDLDRLRGGLGRLFAGETGDRQALAAAATVLRRLAVVAGGPGTGKTTTVARIVALLHEQADGDPPLVALAAPTARAAARLAEAVRDEAVRLDVAAAVRERLLALEASTLHRLLGWGRSGRRPRHPLPHDVVIVDETSMVSLEMMARLLAALRPGARLILVGDPAQLASIEAGAVLGDIVGPAADGLRIGPAARATLARATGHEVAAADPPPGAAIADGIVVLDRVHRFGPGIARLAEAIRGGDADGAVAALSAAPERVSWLAAEAAEAAVRGRALAAARRVAEAARAGDAQEALAALNAFRLLCAHRRGPDGVATWTARVERWLDVGDHEWYAGRPLLVTENDYELRLFNGDTGVVVQREGDRLTAAFQRASELVEVSPSRLGAIDTAYAMTVHKSQGSQFDTAAVLLPEPGARILTRELLYTAATRARERLVLVGSEEAVRSAVARPIARASGLRDRLWGAAEQAP